MPHRLPGRCLNYPVVLVDFYNPAPEKGSGFSLPKETKMFERNTGGPRPEPRTVEEAAEAVYQGYEQIKWLALFFASAILTGLAIGLLIRGA